jgi:hypothetical protein
MFPIVFYVLGGVFILDIIYAIAMTIVLVRLRMAHADDLQKKYQTVKNILFAVSSMLILAIVAVGFVYFSAAPAASVSRYPISDPILPQPSPCDFRSGPCAPMLEPDKPVIYLYPTHEEPVSITLDYQGTLTDMYPSFDSGSTWNVTAFPDGHLIDAKDGKEYSYLFWEGKDSHDYDLSQGFVVKGSDTAAFLQAQLAAMGLTPKEYNEFIVYWLPKLEHNPYNLIHFAGSDYTDVARLTITPSPQSILRIFMIYHPLSQPISVQSQSFPKFQRNGFTVVEWGGTEL